MSQKPNIKIALFVIVVVMAVVFIGFYFSGGSVTGEMAGGSGVAGTE